jgi:SARP family transcriptional regulator, regulator of embCAB operon
MFREGLRSVLASEPSFHVVGQATTGHDALSLVRAKKPDLLLIDFELPEPPALTVLRQIEEEGIVVQVDSGGQDDPGAADDRGARAWRERRD